MRVLIVSALFGGVFTATLVWFWQRDLVFVLLLAPIGGSFAALLGAAFGAVAEVVRMWGGAVSGVRNPDSGVGAPDRQPRHDVEAGVR